MASKLILNRIVYRFDGDRAVLEDTSPECDVYKRGDALVTWAGAPGTGRTVYRITRVDQRGVWGVEVSDTARVLSPQEVA